MFTQNDMKTKSYSSITYHYHSPVLHIHTLIAILKDIRIIFF